VKGSQNVCKKHPAGGKTSTLGTDKEVKKDEFFSSSKEGWRKGGGGKGGRSPGGKAT